MWANRPMCRTTLANRHQLLRNLIGVCRHHHLGLKRDLRLGVTGAYLARGYRDSAKLLGCQGSEDFGCLTSPSSWKGADNSPMLLLLFLVN